MKLKQVALALLAIGLGSTAHASDAERIAQLESQMKQLMEQLQALKASTPSAKEVSELKDQVAAQGKEAVVGGDIPGSFRVPGSDTSVRLYGVAEVDMVKEWKGDGGANDYSTFMPYMPLRGSANAQRSGEAYLTARTSRIGVEASTPTQYGQLMAKVEGDFNNDPRTGNSQVDGSLQSIYTQQATNSYGFRLRHAYFQLGPWLVGQTWSTFMDVDNTPETVDFNGPIGSTFIRQPQIRYTYTTPEYGNFSAAIENSSSYVLDPTGTATSAGFAKVPDLVARWDRTFNWGSLSFRGVTHELRVNGDINVAPGVTQNANQSNRGYGLAASGQIKTVGDDFISWIVTGGHGIGRYFNYIEGASYDPVANKVLMEKSLGLVLGYQRKFSETFRMNFVLGTQKTYNNDYTDFAIANGFGTGQYGVNRRVTQAHIGGIWNPIKLVDVGLEYIWGERETLLGDKGDMSRVNLMARYNLN
ncbi:MAG: hypothetical protein H6R17_605 [Proteobacteria bacterium]|nr:hypothetical protein [Pseudomonadota bacterium]